MYMCTNPLIKLQNVRKRLTHAFCHTHVEILLKGPGAHVNDYCEFTDMVVDGTIHFPYRENHMWWM